MSPLQDLTAAVLAGTVEMNRVPILPCKELVAMIPYSQVFDQQTMTRMLDHDPVVQRYRRFFALFDWSVVPPRSADRAWPGPEPHPQIAYIKALLVKLCEGYPSITQLRRFLVEHPLLVFELGFEGIAASPRHRSGIALRFPRMLRWRTDKKAEDADTLDHVRGILEVALTHQSRADS